MTDETDFDETFCDSCDESDEEGEGDEFGAKGLLVELGLEERA